MAKQWKTCAYLADKFEFDQSGRKSTQAIASHRKYTQVLPKRIFSNFRELQWDKEWMVSYSYFRAKV